MPRELHPSLIQTKALSLLRRLLVFFWLFVRLLLLLRLLRRGLRVLLLRRRPRFCRRRSVLGLRPLARRRSLWPLSRLIPTRLRPRIRLGRRRTVRFRLRGRRTGRFRLLVRLCRRRTVRFRLFGRLRGASGVVLWMRGWRIGRRLNGGMLGRRVIRRPCRFGRYDCAIAKCSRLRSSSDCGFAMIHGSPLLRVRAGSLRMLSLNGYSRNMFLTRHSLILSRGPRAAPASAAVEADPVHRGAVDHRGVVNVVTDGGVHVVHRLVVEKVSFAPTPPFIASPEEPVAETTPAIETDMRTPVAI